MKGWKKEKHHINLCSLECQLYRKGKNTDKVTSIRENPLDFLPFHCLCSFYHSLSLSMNGNKSVAILSIEANRLILSGSVYCLTLTWRAVISYSTGSSLFYQHLFCTLQSKISEWRWGHNSFLYNCWKWAVGGWQLESMCLALKLNFNFPNLSHLSDMCFPKF